VRSKIVDEGSSSSLRSVAVDDSIATTSSDTLSRLIENKYYDV
jgi:hypothetical protein